jgi:hypothetical protein
MRQSLVGEPAATAALNFGTPRRRSSLKRLCPFWTPAPQQTIARFALVAAAA